MAIPSTRQGLIDYCLRQLGHPVLEINIDDDQIEDRIDEALQFFQEYHFDAVELVYLQEKISASTLKINGVNAAAFTVGETVTGSTSGLTATIRSVVAANEFTATGMTGTFTVGETITGSVSGQTATVNTSSVGNYDNKYLTLSDSVIGVVKVLPFDARTRGIDLFDVRYQILLNDIYSLQSTDLIYYTQVRSQLQLMNDLLVGQKPVRFNKHQNRVYVDMDWNQDVVIGEYIVVQAYRILDPDSFTDVYNDMFLKRYATALIKKQWGSNLKKFEGVQLPGGVTLNGQKIYDEAVDEIKQIELEVDSRYQLPVDFFTG